jgi:hypothetical protein
LKPYWGKPAVRNFRGGDGNGGIIRSPQRAIVLPDCGGRGEILPRPMPSSTFAMQQDLFQVEAMNFTPSSPEAYPVADSG